MGRGYLFEESLFFVLGHVGGVPLGETGTAVAADEKKAMNHFRFMLQPFKNYKHWWKFKTVYF